MFPALFLSDLITAAADLLVTRSGSQARGDTQCIHVLLELVEVLALLLKLFSKSDKPGWQ